MIATAFTALAFTSFTNQQELGPSRAFGPSWWFWLVMTGLGLGMTVSIKWVGLFTIAWVGCLTLVQLWVLLGDYKHVSVVRLSAPPPSPSLPAQVPACANWYTNSASSPSTSWPGCSASSSSR